MLWGDPLWEEVYSDHWNTYYRYTLQGGHGFALLRNTEDTAFFLQVLVRRPDGDRDFIIRSAGFHARRWSEPHRQGASVCPRPLQRIIEKADHAEAETLVWHLLKAVNQSAGKLTVVQPRPQSWGTVKAQRRGVQP